MRSADVILPGSEERRAPVSALSLQKLPGLNTPRREFQIAPPVSAETLTMRSHFTPVSQSSGPYGNDGYGQQPGGMSVFGNMSPSVFIPPAQYPLAGLSIPCFSCHSPPWPPMRRPGSVLHRTAFARLRSGQQGPKEGYEDMEAFLREFLREWACVARAGGRQLALERQM